jgi:hypothetical protein
VVFAVGLANAGRSLRLLTMIHPTPLRADLPVGAFHVRTLRLG